MTATVVLALVVAADVARGARLAQRARRALAALVVAAVGTTLVVGFGAHVVTVAVGAVAAAAWSLLVPRVGATPGGAVAPPRAWPAAVLAVVLVAAALVPAPEPAGPLVDAWARTVPGREGVPVAVALAVLVVLVGLTRTANLVTRAALARARQAPDGNVPVVDNAGRPTGLRPTGWRLAVRGRDVASLSPVEAPPEPRTGPVMRGGRYIGPLERVLVLVLALTGAYGVIAAVLAAKGVVRFPEISADRARGTKAEEFLVGSLVSWACAGAGVLLVRVSGLG